MIGSDTGVTIIVFTDLALWCSASATSGDHSVKMHASVVTP